MPTTTTLLLFVASTLALLAVPGPSVVYVVTRTLEQGRRAGLVSVLGLDPYRKSAGADEWLACAAS